jgi:quinol monooxygenase YgiN
MREPVLSEFKAIIPAVHAEAGCIEYTPVIDVAALGSGHTALGPDSFVVIEKWESAEALHAHAAAPHMKVYGSKTGHMVEARVIHVLSAA